MKNFRPLIGFLILLSASGCASLHQAAQPPLPGPLPSRFLEDGTTEDLSEPGRFWERFNDPRLNELESNALDGNLTIKQAMARYDQFTALEKISRSSSLPFLNLTGSTGRDKPLSMSGNSEGSTFKLAAVAGYEIDLWNRLGSARNSAAHSRQASVADIKTAFISVAAQVADLYYLAVEQRAQLALTDRIIASQAETLSRMEERYTAGLVPPLDVYQARQNILAARARKPVLRANLAKVGHAWATLLGHFAGADLAGNPAELPAELPAAPAGLPSELLSRRPDIEAALLRIKARDQEVAAAVAARFPSFNLNAVLGRGSIDYATTISGTFWNVVLDATLPIFDYGRRRSEVDRRRAVVAEEVARYQQTVLRAFQEVEDALVAGRTGQEQIKLLAERYATTTAALRLAEEQYFEGLTDYLSVLTAQKNDFEVQTQLLSARRQLISDRISLMKALGGDWMMADINNRLQESGESK